MNLDRHPPSFECPTCVTVLSNKNRSECNVENKNMQIQPSLFNAVHGKFI